MSIKVGSVVKIIGNVYAYGQNLKGNIVRIVSNDIGDYGNHEGYFVEFVYKTNFRFSILNPY